MPYVRTSPDKYGYADKPLAVSTVTPPVKDTWYTIFDDVGLDTRLLIVVTSRDNTAHSAADIEIEFVVDGNVYDAYWSSLAATAYWYYVNSGSLGRDTSQRVAVLYVDMRGHSVRVRWRQTSVVAAGETMTATANRQQLERS